jgi:hypothetical protein
MLAEVETGNFIIVVEPWPGDHYPKYLVRFESVIEIRIYDEALCGFEARLSPLTGWIRGLKAYERCYSPSAQSCQKYAEFRAWPEPRHYLIIGEDSVVEVISSYEPQFERVDEKRFIEARYEI